MKIMIPFRGRRILKIAEGYSPEDGGDMFLRNVGSRNIYTAEDGILQEYNCLHSPAFLR
jgi:hypothetical protein